MTSQRGHFLRALLRPSVAAGALFGLAVAHACSTSTPEAATPKTASRDGGLAATTGHSGECLDLSRQDCRTQFGERLEIVADLRRLALTRDRRTLPAAELALSLGDPEIADAGLRLLGTLDCPPRASDLALPFAADPHVSGRELALRIVACDSSRQRLLDQYKVGHARMGELFAPTAVDLPPDQRAIGFPPVGTDTEPARRYPIGDSPISVAYLVTGSVESVAADLAREGKGELTAAEDVATRLRESTPERRAARGAKANERLMQIQAALANGEMTSAEADREVALSLYAGEVPLPDSTLLGAGRGVVLSTQDGAVIRAAFVYAEPLFDSTVVIFAWDGDIVPAYDRTPQSIGEYLSSR